MKEEAFSKPSEASRFYSRWKLPRSKIFQVISKLLVLVRQRFYPTCLSVTPNIHDAGGPNPMPPPDGKQAIPGRLGRPGPWQEEGEWIQVSVCSVPEFRSRVHHAASRERDAHCHESRSPYILRPTARGPTTPTEIQGGAIWPLTSSALTQVPKEGVTPGDNVLMGRTPRAAGGCCGILAINREAGTPLPRGLCYITGLMAHDALGADIPLLLNFDLASSALRLNGLPLRRKCFK